METDTRNEIMRATRRALCTHGYAELTIQRIADESSLSTAAIHYHFDTKEGLLRAFLGETLDGFEGKLAARASDPRERLETFLNVVFSPPQDDDGEFAVALMELKAQAPFHEAYRDRLVEMDELMRGVVADAVRDGIESDHFRDADPETVARLVVTAINATHARQVALGEDPEETRRLIEADLRERLGWSPEVAA
ncbi:TetR/AcrR family transcriptional regulator [Halomicroarcula limicola]|uniref:TetR/AcrR family transcriptional regulator n=1 Tax=Haloarcula limicola TaxID=1429915 RepID=A0A8J8CA38_9EURY|nr:TetR/AcrR family transcriptional regulator [Halomicroarcula limicola]MBV0926095.1 TetR/AcrR family transcriptional regulator [Halomicroarcula limicola]